MDAQQQLVWDSEISVVVLGKGTEFVLVPLGEPGPIPKEITEDAKRRGLRFCGVLGRFKDGSAGMECEPDVESMSVMARACFGFAGLLERQTGDSAEWLKKLWTLPDTRSEFSPES